MSGIQDDELIAHAERAAPHHLPVYTTPAVGFEGFSQSLVQGVHPGAWMGLASDVDLDIAKPYATPDERRKVQAFDQHIGSSCMPGQVGHEVVHRGVPSLA